MTEDSGDRSFEIKAGMILDLRQECRDCRFWTAGGFAEVGWGTCRRADFMDNEAVYPDSTAVAKDSEGLSASLSTRPEHGCTMFEKAQKKAPAP